LAEIVAVNRLDAVEVDELVVRVGTRIQAKIIRVVNAQKQIRHVMRDDALGRGAQLLEDVVHIQTAGQRREQAVVRVQLREVFNPDVHRHTSSCSTCGLTRCAFRAIHFLSSGR